MHGFFAGKHIGKLLTVAHQIAKLPDIWRWNKAGLDHDAHKQVTDLLGVLLVGFVAFLRLRVFGVCESDPTGFLKDVEHGNPVLAGRFHTNFFALVFCKPVS